MKWPVPPLLPSQGEGRVDDEVRAQVWGLLAAVYHRDNFVERRRDNRYPFPWLVHITPIDPNGAGVETVVVVGKHLSESGLGFYHREPLPYRRVIASLEAGDGAWFAFVLELTWCRFTTGGWYESGGKFIEATSSPLEA